MGTSLFDLSIPNYRQTLDAIGSVLKTAKTHFQAQGLELDAIVGARLAPDMRPFRFQIQSVVFHSVGALEALERASISPPVQNETDTFDQLQALVERSRSRLEDWDPVCLEALAGTTVVFDVRGSKLRLAAPDFIQSFSLPNLHFHAATAYGLLRTAGVPLTKMDYLGRLRLSPED